MAGASTIDKLPEIERRKVIKALTEAGEVPNFRLLIKTLGLKCSHHSLWRYHRDKIKPTIQRNAAAIVESVDHSNVHQVSRDSFEQELDLVRQTQTATQQALADDPIVSAVIAKRRRLEQAIEKTHSTEQYDVYAKLETVDLRALEMHAKAMQHPGFTAAAAPQAGGNTVVVIMPSNGDMRTRRAAWAEAGEVIDVEPGGE